MSDWDASDSEEPKIVIPIKKSWDDEDLEEVKDSWEVSDEEEVKETAAPKKKVPLAQKIAEREARLLEEKAKKEAASKPESELTAEELKARREEQRRIQEAADLQNAADLFSGIDIKEASGEIDLDPSTTVTGKLEALNEFNPKTKADFDQLQTQLSEMILKFKANRNYPSFVENLVRSIVEPLKDVDVRKIASNATASANAKQKAAKDALKGKKKGAKKSNVRVEADDVGLSAKTGYDEDEYDDFM